MISKENREIRRLMLFFALIYVVEGIGQARVGILSQPLTAWLKSLGWSTVQVTAFLSIPNLPWLIKPVFGLISDCLPLFGSRRRAYLLLANAGGVVAYGCMLFLATPGALALPLLLTGYAMAVASTLCGGLLVEGGQRYGNSGALVSQQWLWFNIATVLTSLAGGELVEHFSPIGALHSAAGVASLAPIPVLFAVWRLAEEATVKARLKQRLRSIIQALKTRRLWLIGFVLFLYQFSPGFGTPLYYHMTDDLHFSQSLIGELGAVSALGWILGALLLRGFLRRCGTRRLLYLGIVLGSFSTLSFLLLQGPVSGVLVNLGSGLSSMVTTVAALTLAAESCPDGAEGFAFAGLMSLMNLADPVSNNSGAWLFEHVFDDRLPPLIFVSAIATAFASILIPLLRLKN